MRYILLIFSLLLIGCNQNTNNKIKEKNNTTMTKHKIKKQTKIIVKFPNLVFKEKNNTIFYETNKTNILLFTNDNKLSTEQKKELNKNRIKFYSINKNKLKKYFNITIFPTIIILDKNKTKKYEGFIPYEVLKYEIKD